MARTRTLTNLIADVRFITDNVNAGARHPDNNITRAINQGIARLWALLVQSDPLRYLSATVDSISTTSGTKEYTLNTDFYSAVHVSRVSGSNRYTLERFNIGEIDRYRGASTGGWASHYAIAKQGIAGTGGRIWFEPDPGSATYELEYIQQPQELSAGTDVFDGVAGWEEYVVAYAARQLMIRDGDFDTGAVQFWTLEIKRLKREIESESAVRDAGSSPTTQEIWRGGDVLPYP